MSSIVYKLKKPRKKYYREITYTSKYQSTLKLEKHNIVFQTSVLDYIKSLDMLPLKKPLDFYTGKNITHYKDLDSFIEEEYDPGAAAIEVQSSIYEPLVELYKNHKEFEKGRKKHEKELEKKRFRF